MKKIITILFALSAAAMNTSQGQEIKQDKDGNFYEVAADTTTKKTFKDLSGKLHPVFRNPKNGRLYYMKENEKTGAKRREYLPDPVESNEPKRISKSI